MATTVRLDDKTADTVRELAKMEKRPIGQVIESAIEKYQKDKFWDEVEASVNRLKADPEALQDYRAEIRQLEGGSMDGLYNEESYFTASEIEEIRAKRA